MFVLCRCHVASPHPQSILEGEPRAEFIVSNRDVHNVSMIDLVVADWKGSAQGTCWYLQRDVDIMSVETSTESADEC